jgi:glycine/D-amino acid oxidase-like deaminating enzyme
MAMKVNPLATTPWRLHEVALRREALPGDDACEVCIIGAGISGLSTAYQLASRGRSVLVLEDGAIGSGMTGRTTAHLTDVIDDRFHRILRLHGEQRARLAAQSQTAAIDAIEATVRGESIDCQFERVPGYLFEPAGGDGSELAREREAAERLGLAVEQVSRAPWLGADGGPCLRFPRQAQFHPLRYLAGLADAVERRGGKIFTGTRAIGVTGGQRAEVATARGVVRADAVVVATNSPISDRVRVHLQQAPYMTYVIGASVPEGALERALYWDTAEPYHYVRLHRRDDGSDLLIVGGEDHKSGQADDTAERHGRLERWARERVPSMGTVTHRWGGQVMEPMDGLGLIGRDPEGAANVFIVTGDSGQGMTNGALAGLLLRDLILGDDSPWREVYDPARFRPRAVPAYVRETANMAAQMGDWLLPGDVATADEIPPDSGAVLRAGLTKVAVYRDPGGALHRRSAVCPHLGCIVAWNSAERTWDCPCHGSRFDRFGAVINGPANRALAAHRSTPSS